MKRENVRVLLVTAPDEETAARLGTELVRSRLVACVNVVPGVRSLYRWEGKLADEREVLMVIKSTERCVPAIIDRVRAGHPYEVPEVLVLEVAGGYSGYLDWVRAETAGAAEDRDPGEPGPGGTSRGVEETQG